MKAVLQLRLEGEMSFLDKECGMGRTFQAKQEASDMLGDNGTGGKGLEMRSGQNKGTFKLIPRAWIFIHKAMG